MKSMAPIPCSLLLLLAISSHHTVTAAEPSIPIPRPRLQIINASSEKADVFWLNEGGKAEPNGSIEPGKDRIITTTLGHRFAVIGTQSKTRLTVESIAHVQGFRFAPEENNGTPSFYTRRFSHGQSLRP